MGPGFDVREMPRWFVNMIAVAAIAVSLFMTHRLVTELFEDHVSFRESIESLSQIVAGQQLILKGLTGDRDTQRIHNESVQERLRRVEGEVNMLKDRWERIGGEPPQNGPPVGG